MPTKFLKLPEEVSGTVIVAMISFEMSVTFLWSKLDPLSAGRTNMLGFTLPLLVLSGLEAIVALVLMLPLPAARPAILLCQSSNSQVGRTVMITVAGFLTILTLAPLYDLVTLHKMKYESKGTEIRTSEARESEATSNLSAILTVSTLLTMFVVRKLGLALGEIDRNGGWSTQKSAGTVKAE